MAGIGLILSVVGTGLSVVSKIQEGKFEQAALNYQAKSDEMKAKEEVAAGQREMLEKRLEGERLYARQRTVAAASGAGTVNPSVLGIYEETAEEQSLQERMLKYGGDSRARGLQDKAIAARAKGKAASSGATLSAIATGVSGLGSAFKGYG